MLTKLKVKLKRKGILQGYKFVRRMGRTCKSENKNLA